MADRSPASECESDCISECRNMSTGLEVCYIAEMFQSILGKNYSYSLNSRQPDLSRPADLIG